MSCVQADLGGISKEIRDLQDESLSMSIKLQNRRDAESQLQKYLDKIVLPPDMVSTITGKDISDAYIGIDISSLYKMCVQISFFKDKLLLFFTCILENCNTYLPFRLPLLEYIHALNAKIEYVSMTTPAPDGSSLDLSPLETQAGKVFFWKLAVAFLFFI